MSGKRVWWYFFSFFVLIIAVDTTMMTLALRTHSGPVTDHPYEKGLAYNRVVEAEQKQEELGWKSSIEYKNDALVFALYDKDKHPLTPDKAVASFIRPTRPGMDFTAELKEGRAPISIPAKGLWEVRVDATYQGVHYQQSKRIIIE